MSKDLIVEFVLAFIPNLTVACSFVNLFANGRAYQPLPRSLPFELAPDNPVEAPQSDLDAGSRKLFAQYGCP